MTKSSLLSHWFNEYKGDVSVIVLNIYN